MPPDGMSSSYCADPCQPHGMNRMPMPDRMWLMSGWKQGHQRQHASPAAGVKSVSLRWGTGHARPWIEPLPLPGSIAGYRCGRPWPGSPSSPPPVVDPERSRSWAMGTVSPEQPPRSVHQWQEPPMPMGSPSRRPGTGGSPTSSNSLLLPESPAGMPAIPQTYAQGVPAQLSGWRPPSSSVTAYRPTLHYSRENDPLVPPSINSRYQGYVPGRTDVTGRSPMRLLERSTPGAHFYSRPKTSME